MSNYLKEHAILIGPILSMIAIIVAAIIAARATMITSQSSATATKEAEIMGTTVANVIRETVNAITPESVEIEVTRLVSETEEVEVTREVKVTREIEVTREVEVEIEVTRLITVEAPIKNEDPPPDPPTQEDVIAIVNTTANIRSGPGISYLITAAASKNDEFKVVGKICDGSWWQISYTSEQLGWIHNSVVDIPNPSDDVPCIALDLPQITIQITNPDNGSTVDQNTSVTFNVIGEIPNGYRPIVMIHPLPDFPYYPWWQPDLVSSTGWVEPVIVGGSADAGVSFEVIGHPPPFQHLGDAHITSSGNDGAGLFWRRSSITRAMYSHGETPR